jgi:GH43 family beta-xylosidase
MKIIAVLVFALQMMTAAAQVTPEKTFTNPILPSGADPWIIFNNGYYYYTHTTGKNLMIWKTKNVTDMRNATRKIVWTPPGGTPYSKEIWAPELHYFQHKWYMYFAADDGVNKHHRLYVIENSSLDPTEGEWVFKGQINDASNKWAIDASVFENNGKLYMIWSGWEDDENGEQDIYIARLKDPLTVESSRVKISVPVLPWERFGDLKGAINPSHVNVNEGPEILKHDYKLFLIYSASGCWTDNYALGMLTANSNGDLLDPGSWKKSPDPVFSQSPGNSVYATGHCTFFKSPNGKQDWIIYHANSMSGQGCGKERSPRAQPFTWRKDGSPDFGIPLATTELIPLPSGTQ